MPATASRRPVRRQPRTAARPGTCGGRGRKRWRSATGSMMVTFRRSSRRSQHLTPCDCHSRPVLLPRCGARHARNPALAVFLERAHLRNGACTNPLPRPAFFARAPSSHPRHGTALLVEFRSTGHRSASSISYSIVCSLRLELGRRCSDACVLSQRNHATAARNTPIDIHTLMRSPATWCAGSMRMFSNQKRPNV